MGLGFMALDFMVLGVWGLGVWGSSPRASLHPLGFGVPGAGSTPQGSKDQSGLEYMYILLGGSWVVICGAISRLAIVF